MHNFDLDLLRTFVAVVEQESFGSAAQTVGRTQSAISQRMQRLEDQIGRPLLERAGRGKKLTADGRKLLEYARRMLQVNDEAWHVLSGRVVAGEIRLGAPHDVTDTILPNLLAHCAAVFPDLRVSIQVDRSPNLLNALRQGDIDMSVVAALHAPDLPNLTLRTSPIVWMCSSVYRYDPALPLQLAVADEPSFFRRLAIEHLDRAQTPWRIAYTSPTVVGVRAAVRAGVGVTARAVEMLGSDLRVLGDEAALPRLPDVSFRLYLGPGATHPLARQLFDSLSSRSL